MHHFGCSRWICEEVDHSSFRCLRSSLVNVKSNTSNLTLVGFRAGTSTIGSVYLSNTGKLGVAGLSGNGGAGSQTTMSQNVWHAIEFHMTVNAGSSSTEVWLDGTLVTDLSLTINAGTATTADTFQLGDTQTTSTRTYDVVYDDAAFGTARLGL